MSNQKKTVEKYRETPVLRIPSSNERVVHVPSSTQEEDARPKVAFPFMLFTIAATLFLLAYAGPDIGNVLAYLVIPAVSFFPGVLVWERFGKVPGILAGLLVLAILTPVYGATVIANSISLFTSLQTISQGILVLFGITSLLFGLASFWLRIRRR